MLVSWIFMLIFGLLIIAMPEIIAYIIWWLFIFIWISTLSAYFAFNRYRQNKHNSDWEYFTFWNYKIYKNKKK